MAGQVAEIGLAERGLAGIGLVEVGLVEVGRTRRRAMASLPNDSVQDVDITVTPP